MRTRFLKRIAVATASLSRNHITCLKTVSPLISGWQQLVIGAQSYIKMLKTWDDRTWPLPLERSSLRGRCGFAMVWIIDPVGHQKARWNIWGTPQFYAELGLKSPARRDRYELSRYYGIQWAKILREGLTTSYKNLQKKNWQVEKRYLFLSCVGDQLSVIFWDYTIIFDALIECSFP